MSDHIRQNDRSPDTTSLYVWLSRDADGIEGIIQVPSEQGVIPLVTADRNRALRLRGPATVAAQRRGFPAKLVRFERAEEIDSVGAD